VFNRASENSDPQRTAAPFSNPAGLRLIRQGLGTTDGIGRFELHTFKAEKMKTLSALPLLLIIAFAGSATPARAGETVATSATAVKEDAATDCSKQVWPHFTPTCLRNDQATVVRIVTVNRR
jgi:hypothetical protein